MDCHRVLHDLLASISNNPSCLSCYSIILVDFLERKPFHQSAFNMCVC